jgi:hypothetical protein
MVLGYPRYETLCKRNKTFEPKALYRSPAADDAQQEHDDRGNQEEVNEPAHGHLGDQAQSPKNNEKYGYRDEHV